MNQALFFFLCIFSFLKAQTVLTFSEFMDYVLNFHPIAKTANLQSQRGSLYIREAKGNYDPQLNYQNKIKTFNNKNYYFNQLAEFSIPLWWNADLKTSWERNIGTKIAPEHSTPQEGLFGLGISVPLTQSLIIDARRNAVLIARQMDKMANADRLLILNDLIYDAALAYLDWALAYSQNLQYQAIINIAAKRREFILSQFENGFASELDTTDAFNNLINRQIEARENLVFLNNARYAVSNFLWNENMTPLEIPDNFIPEPIDSITIFPIQNTLDWIEEHPAILKYQAKALQLQLERKLKLSKLMPKLVAEYNFLRYPSHWNDFEKYRLYESYKAGIKFSFPLFLRKERADLGFANIKIQENDFSLALKRLELKNKFLAYYNNFLLYQEQLLDIQTAIKNYQRLYDGEFQRFQIGESNVLNLIIRENILLSNQLKLWATWQKFLKSHFATLWSSAKLFENFNK